LAYQIAFDEKRRIVLVTFYNDLTESALTRAYFAVAAFASANPLEGVLIDLTYISEFGIRSDFVWEFISTRDPVAAGKPHVVAAPDDTAFGMARMFQMYRNLPNDNFDVFRTMDEAVGLLGLTLSEFKPIAGSGEMTRSAGG
jgi:hypothetical protein